MLNLLSNAIKFTPEGGRIDVRAALVDGFVEVSVSDNGLGFSAGPGRDLRGVPWARRSRSRSLLPDRAEDQDAIFEEFRGLDVHVHDPSSGPDARWCLEQYFAELGERFEAGFDQALSISADAHELTPPAGLLLLARLRQEPVGCGALKLHDGAPAEIKRMWVARGARGLGLGRRLLHDLERHAMEAGVAVVRLETNQTLTEAIALYRRAGYREVAAFNDEPYAHHWFEKRLV